MRKRSQTSAAVFFLASSLFAAAPAFVQAQTADDVVALLRGGGHVIFMRHPQTDQAQKDVNVVELGPCETQRNLSDKGREAARSVGEAFRKLEIPVSLVVSSQFCRARETATLMGLGEAATPSDLNMTDQAVPREENERRWQELRKILSTAPKAGGNTLLISHSPNINGVIKVEPGLAEGEMAAFVPQAEAPGFRLVARIPVAKWSELAKAQTN